MDIKKLEKRNPSMDIVRLVAVFTVVSIHFFYNNGFYSQPIDSNPAMFIMVQMRTVFSVCVPMFMILSGYLMCHKTLSKGYYAGLSKTIIVYVLSAFACMWYKGAYLHQDFSSPGKFLGGILDFSGSQYSWYVEMYIGLFLIIPFLNLAYNGLKNQKQKQILVLSFAAITILPSLFNIFNFDSAEWWGNPASVQTYQQIIPDFWVSMYPIAYYFAGCYLREYGLKIKTGPLLIFFVLSSFVFGVFNFYRSYGTTFIQGTYVYWYGFECYVMTGALFTLLSRIKAQKMNTTGKFILWKLSDLAFGAYLMSYISDQIVYPMLNNNVPVYTDKLPWYLVFVPLSFVIALILSAILNLIEWLIMMVYREVKKSIQNNSKKAQENAEKQVLPSTTKKAKRKMDKDSEKAVRRLQKNNLKNQDIAFICVMAVIFFICCWKATLGFGGNDEAFYLTIPHRISLGDSLLFDEWHLSQLSGFLLTPFVWLYRTITGSTEGIILAARFFYVIMHGAVSVLLYTRLRKYSWISVLGCSLFFLYTPFNIMAYSYNTMGVDLLAVAGILLATAPEKKPLLRILSGLAFAGSVLCCPYLMFVYILYGVGVVVSLILKKAKKTNTVFSTDMFTIRTFLWFTAGAAILAVIFLAVLLSRVSLGKIFEALPLIMSDPEHPSYTIGKSLEMYWNSIFKCHTEFYVVVYSFAAVLLALAVDRKRKKHRCVYLILTIAIAVVAEVLFLPKITSSYYNSVMFPMVMIGLVAYILLDNKPKMLLAAMYVPSLVYGLMISMTSNQFFYVISMASVVSAPATITMTGMLLKEIKDRPDELNYSGFLRYTSISTVVLMMVVMFGMEYTIRTTHCFWEMGGIDSLTSRIEEGPAKGIYTTPTKAQTIESINNDLQSYNDLERGNILCITDNTWTYLALNDYPYGTLSAWNANYLANKNEDPYRYYNIDRLYQYFNINPEKIPKYIYIPKEAGVDFSTIYTDAPARGYSVEENGVSYKLTRQ